ncbi:MAG: hypothetical protein ACD_39C01926G0001 [uncultured bacterium]|nr:MAG: hypothetical protein ACD_39C01926G0001 [uncultured bacterium]
MLPLQVGDLNFLRIDELPGIHGWQNQSHDKGKDQRNRYDQHFADYFCVVLLDRIDKVKRLIWLKRADSCANRINQCTQDFWCRIFLGFCRRVFYCSERQKLGDVFDHDRIMEFLGDTMHVGATTKDKGTGHLHFHLALKIIKRKSHFLRHSFKVSFNHLRNFYFDSAIGIRHGFLT